MRLTLSVDDTQQETQKRPLKLLLRVVLAIIALWVVGVSAKVMFPSQGEVHVERDAVVSLAPQHHRLYTATRLTEVGHTDTLVVSHFDGDVGFSDAGQQVDQVSVTDYCDTHEGEGVICFTPDEVATIGEAFTVRDIAAQQSWESLTVVTSRYHAFRAHYIFEQCVGDDVDVNLVHADPGYNVLQWAWYLAYENAAFIKALWQTTVRC
jgi:hypothetical protein